MSASILPHRPNGAAEVSERPGGRFACGRLDHAANGPWTSCRRAWLTGFRGSLIPFDVQWTEGPVRPQRATVRHAPRNDPSLRRGARRRASRRPATFPAAGIRDAGRTNRIDAPMPASHPAAFEKKERLDFSPPG